MKSALFVFLLGISHWLNAQDSLWTIDLESVFINAVRASDEAPVSQNTYTRKDIQSIDLGQNSSILIESLSPSVVTYSDAGTNFGNYNQFRLRGIDQTRINITLNGVPLNDMVDQGVFFSNFSDFSSSISSLQVQRGVGISANGTASYGGSVNFESVKLKNSVPSGELALNYGSFQSGRFNAQAQTGNNDNGLAAYARVSRIYSGGYKHNSSANAQSFFFSGAKFFLRSSLKVTAFAGKTQNDQSYLPVLLPDIESDPKTNYNLAGDRDDFEQAHIQVQYAKLLKDEMSMDATMYYNGSGGFFPFGLDANTQLLYGLQNDHLGAFTNLNYYGARLNLTGGVHGYRFFRSNQTALAPTLENPYYEDKTTKDELSAFAKAEWLMGDWSFFGDLQLRTLALGFQSDSLKIYAGDETATLNYTFLNLRIGVTYRINNFTNLYTSFGRSGREPTRTDFIQGDANSAISSANFRAFVDKSVVREEYVNDLEVGFRYLRPDLQIQTNIFYMSFENEISIVGGLSQNSYVPLRQNVANSQRLGVELQTSYQLVESVEVKLQGTYLATNVDAFETGAERLTDVAHAFAPEWIIQPELRWHMDRLTLHVNWRYLAESFMELSNDDNFKIPSSNVVNLGASWQASAIVSVDFRINNLLDELYFTDGAPVDLNFDGIPEGPGYRIQPPRNIFMGINFRF